MRAANFAPHRISFVFELYEDGHTSRMSSGDWMCPAATSGPNAQSSRSASTGRYWPHRIG